MWVWVGVTVRSLFPEDYNSSDPVLINGLTITTTANHGNIGFRTLSIDTSNEAAVSTMLRTDVTEASFVARELPPPPQMTLICL